MQSHGREVDEEGWNSSGPDSEGVQRSAHSTPHAAALPKAPFGPSARPEGKGKDELQVTSRSRSAFIPRRLKQVLPFVMTKVDEVGIYIKDAMLHGTAHSALHGQEYVRHA